MLKDEFLQDFAEEAKAHIERIEEALLNANNTTKDPDIINKAFRAVHSIKGSAGFFHLDKIVSLSHSMENVLGQVRSNHLSLSEDVSDALLSCNDLLRHMVDHIEESGKVNIASSLNQLEALTNNPLKPQYNQTQDNEYSNRNQGIIKKNVHNDRNQETLKKDVHNDRNQETLKKDVHNDQVEKISEKIEESFYPKLYELIKHGHKIYKIKFLYSKTFSYYKKIESFFDNIKTLGQLITISVNTSTHKSFKEVIDLLESSKNEDSWIEVLATSVLAHELFCQAISMPQSSTLWIKPQAILDKSNRPMDDKPIENNKKPTKSLLAEKPLTSSPSIPLQDETVRVNVKTLEKLMALSGEMVLARNQLLTTYNNKKFEPAEMERILQKIDLLTTKLQGQVMQTRMQPIGNIFNKFPRLIRDISKSIHKEIYLTLEGSEMELDKTMLESLGDPLIHLVRNAADHGIESPSEREKVGKPPQGKISLKAYHKGGLIAVEIGDDGKGIDIPSVKAKALEKGLISPRQAESLTDQQVFELLFLPGFSTTNTVSDISGRGVGMDVVRKNIEKLGGAVSISSEKGFGTKITLILPRTLAIIHSLIVGTGGQRFAIPQVNIAKVMTLKEEDAPIPNGCRENQFEEYGLPGKSFPLFRLSDILETKADKAPPLKLVILNILNRQMGLLVDQIFDSQEILVKPLPSLLKHCISYSGVTIMGDGIISLILDPEGVAKKSGYDFHNAEILLHGNESIKSELKPKCEGVLQ